MTKGSKITEILSVVISFVFIFIMILQGIILYRITYSITTLVPVFICNAGLVICCILFLYLMRRRIVQFSDHLCTTFDEMLEGNNPIQEVDEEGLLYKINHRLDKLYEILNSRQKKIEDEKREMKELVTDISHQVKTPIANLNMIVTTLKDNDVPKERQKDFLSSMGKELEKLTFLMQAMIKSSRLETGVIRLKKDKQSIYETLASALGEIYLSAEKKSLEVNVDCPETLECTHDRKWTSEAIFNIIDNAVKYTPEQGKIDISVSTQEFYIKIDIADTGIGIPESKQAEIFKRFYRDSEVHEVQGTGIGLYLARKIIMMESGYIKVTSEVGKGSVFSVFLPV